MKPNIKIYDILADNELSAFENSKQLTFIIFLKTIQEYTKKKGIDYLGSTAPCFSNLSYVESKAHYIQELYDYYRQKPGVYGQLFKGAHNKLSEQELDSIAKIINKVVFINDSYPLGHIYTDIMSRLTGATIKNKGQYFTPPGIVRVMVECIDPKPFRTIYDPACGSGIFLETAASYVKDKHSRDDCMVYGKEIDDLTRRFALLSLLVKDIIPEDDVRVELCDTLKTDTLQKYDDIFANPPFGKRQKRNVKESSFKEVEFLHHIIDSMRLGSKAAVLIPDNILFAGGPYERVRRRLLDETNLHTILRLPESTFGIHCVKTSVLFFECTHATELTMIYDHRTGIKQTEYKYLVPFIDYYHKNRLQISKQTNKDKRVKVLTRKQIEERDMADLYVYFDHDQGSFLKSPREIGADILKKLESLVEGIKKALSMFKD